MDVDRFIALSRWLLGARTFDRATAGSVLEVLQDEPWGRDHLRRLERKLVGPGDDRRRRSSRTSRLRALDDGERWFATHLATTWITGVYFHQRGNRWLAHEKALMHAELALWRPAPGNCTGQFGHWAERPPAASDDD